MRLIGARTCRIAVTVSVAAAAPSIAAAHEVTAGGARAVGWTFEPGVVAALAVTALLYVGGARRLGRRILAPGATLAFAAGMAALVLALVSPLHALGGVLFVAHMVQHEILMLVAAPLLVLARPALAIRAALPSVVRRPLARAGRTPAMRAIAAAALLPSAAWTVHAVALWLWHVPALFEATLRSNTVHALQHASFFASALLFWQVVLAPRQPRANLLARVLMVFTTSVHGAALGALLTVARTPWYPAYATSAPAYGLTALGDQQLGGLVMWVPAGLVYVAAGLALVATALQPRPAVPTRIAVASLGAAGGRSLAAPRRRALGATLCIALLAIAAGCTSRTEQEAIALTGGDPDHGRVALRSYGCTSCHVIPGVRGADGLVGPPLGGIASRVYVAGVLVNTPENLIRWIRHPREVDERTAMPDAGVTEADARDIAGYLYTLK